MLKVLKKRILFCINIVDVRDVAQAHIKALTLERAKNQRFILTAQPVMYEKIMDTLDEEFEADYDMPSKAFYTLEEVEAKGKAGDGVFA
eukprot:CAMPEP_0176356226 /NCGR_PEP_ID=MMETSP0126-20121128/13867_1 /TAXON_ID=141414 ORGANISM="Strombidinopsis acuminatum, Strain SPMC142" /NCGR_SAMPLE_ID=MMETSP0126 /ASSEMBLY_ACC=CAM_ASM_000229 /LENGTH=88 /DNA_ID=CAMNT_0017709233 /DNA_START=643 /DNA_END=909 /DNA_ORIENTATION=-